MTVVLLGTLLAVALVGLSLRGWLRRPRRSDPFPSGTSHPVAPSIRLRLQIALILGPVLLLAAGGFYSLNRDRAQLHGEAARQAEVLASDLANLLVDPWFSELTRIERLGFAWNGGVVLGSWEVPMSYQADLQEFTNRYPNAAVTEVFPLQFRLGEFDREGPVPQPASWRGELSGITALTWDQLEAAATQPDGSNRVQTLRAQLESTPQFPAIQANLAFLRLRHSASTESPSSTRSTLAEALVEFALDPNHRWVQTPAGLPIGAVALGQALKLGKPGQFDTRWYQALAQQVNETPSIITPQLLAAARPQVLNLDPIWGKALDKLLESWQSRERRLALARRIQNDIALDSNTRTNVWIDFQGSRWLVMIEPPSAMETQNANSPGQQTPSEPKVCAISQSILTRSLELAAQSIPNRLPPWLRAEISIEGVTLRSQSSWTLPTDLASPLLMASRSVPLSASGSTLGKDNTQAFGSKPMLEIRLFLADPQALFANQRLRFWLFTGFLLATTGTSVLGVRQAVRTLRKQAELADQKSNFVSSVSHELRAPIASVRLLAESLERGAAGGPERQREYHQLIVAECRRLSALVENVLDATRIDQGRTRFEFEPTDILRLTQEAVRLMSPLAKEAGTQLIGDWPTAGSPPNPWPTPSLDGNAVLRALLNLIDNAIKHSPPQSQILLRMEFVPAHTPNPTSLRWIVEDEGPGVPTDERQRIFDRFHRLGSELRRETPGVGLGLAIVRHTAEAHHGKVWVEDAPSRGSRFILEIPLTPCRES